MLPVKYLECLKSAPVLEVDFVATFIEVSTSSALRLGHRLISDVDVRGEVHHHGQSFHTSPTSCPRSIEPELV